MWFIFPHVQKKNIQYLYKIVDVMNNDLIVNNFAIRFFKIITSSDLGDNLERKKISKFIVPHITFINIVEILFISHRFLSHSGFLDRRKVIL